MATAHYPASIVNFGADHADYTDVIYAAHPNAIQAEVVALETTLGVSPTVSTNPAPTGTWTPGVTFSTISARLANIEQGVSTALAYGGSLTPSGVISPLLLMGA